MSAIAWIVAVLGASATLTGVLLIARAMRTAFTVMGVALVGLGNAALIACAGRPWLGLLFALGTVCVTAVFVFMAHVLLPRGHTADAPIEADPAADAPAREGIGDAALAEAATPRPRLSAAVTVVIFAVWTLATTLTLVGAHPMPTASAAGGGPAGSWILPTIAIAGLLGTITMALAFLFDRPAPSERAEPDDDAAAAAGGAS